MKTQYLIMLCSGTLDVPVWMTGDRAAATRYAHGLAAACGMLWRADRPAARQVWPTDVQTVLDMLSVDMSEPCGVWLITLTDGSPSGSVSIPIGD